MEKMLLAIETAISRGLKGATKNWMKRGGEKMEIKINIPELERIQKLKERNDEILSELYGNLNELNQISVKLSPKKRTDGESNNSIESS